MFNLIEITDNSLENQRPPSYDDPITCNPDSGYCNPDLCNPAMGSLRVIANQITAIAIQINYENQNQ